MTKLRTAPEVESGQLRFLPLSLLDPHPQNPRIVQREELIERLRSHMAERGFGPEHAILVRPFGERYQIVSGHQRVEAARRAGISDVPAWIREMDDAEAYMLLVLSNSQSELSPLEIGLHVLGYVELGKKGRGHRGGLREYARHVGFSQAYLSQVAAAAEVFLSLDGVKNDKSTYHFLDKAQHLYAIHSAPREFWPVLAEAMLGRENGDRGWTVEETEHAVGLVKGLLQQAPDLPPDELSEIIRKHLTHPKTVFSAEQLLGLHRRAEIHDLPIVLRNADLDGPPGLSPADVALLKTVAELKEEYPEEDLSPGRIRRLVENRLKRVRRERAALADPTALTAAVHNADIRLGDFRTALADLEPGSVDLIFTDPPYPKSYLHLWKDLAEVAGRLLAPSGVLIAYTGQYHFEQVWDALRSEPRLEYLWVAGLMTPGLHTQVMARRIRSVFKPLLIFARKPYRPDKWRDDGYISEAPEKELHEWQQSEGAAIHFIQQWSPPHGLVVDPFLGSGTTASAAVRLGRRFVGCDVNPKAVQAARSRIAELVTQHA
jgi:ParB/RepB/Spo0J family partition protein